MWYKASEHAILITMKSIIKPIIKPIFFVLTFLVLLAPILPTNAYAAEEEATVEATVIGVLDWRAAIFSSKEAEKENTRIEKAFKKDSQKLKVLESKISDNRKKLDKNRELLSTEQKEKLLVELQNDVLEYQTLGQELQQNIQSREKKFIEAQTPKMKEAVEKISEEKGLHAILAKDAVVYGRLAVDITDDVIKYLNTKKK